MKTFAENLAELIAGEVARIQSAVTAPPVVQEVNQVESFTPAHAAVEIVAPPMVVVAEAVAVAEPFVDPRVSELETLVGAVKTRRNYWRQMTSEAREYLRAQDKKLTALSKDLEDIIGFIRTVQTTLNTTQTEIKGMRRHWIGPRIPVKNPQRPHRSAI